MHGVLVNQFFIFILLLAGLYHTVYAWGDELSDGYCEFCKKFPEMRYVDGYSCKDCKNDGKALNEWTSQGTRHERETPESILKSSSKYRTTMVTTFIVVTIFIVGAAILCFCKLISMNKRNITNNLDRTVHVHPPPTENHALQSSVTNAYENTHPSVNVPVLPEATPFLQPGVRPPPPGFVCMPPEVAHSPYMPHPNQQSFNSQMPNTSEFSPDLLSHPPYPVPHGPSAPSQVPYPVPESAPEVFDPPPPYAACVLPSSSFQQSNSQELPPKFFATKP